MKRRAGFVISANGKTTKLNDYVVTMCKLHGDDVQATREIAATKSDLYKILPDKYPGWLPKSITRLYPMDFGDEV